MGLDHGIHTAEGEDIIIWRKHYAVDTWFRTAMRARRWKEDLDNARTSDFLKFELDQDMIDDFIMEFGDDDKAMVGDEYGPMVLGLRVPLFYWSSI